MNDISYERLSRENFGEHSLDSFIRHQTAREVWRCIDGSWTLVPCDPEHVWDWPLEKRRQMAKTISDGIRTHGFGWGAFLNGVVIGYIYISTEFWGSENQYARLKLYHISAPFRGMGIGRELFRLGCIDARASGAKKLYISANHSKESQAAYRKLGCTFALEVDPVSAAKEPFDVQMEYQL